MSHMRDLSLRQYSLHVSSLHGARSKLEKDEMAVAEGSMGQGSRLNLVRSFPRSAPMATSFLVISWTHLSQQTRLLRALFKMGHILNLYLSALQCSHAKIAVLVSYKIASLVLAQWGSIGLDQALLDANWPLSHRCENDSAESLLERLNGSFLEVCSLA